MTDGRGVLWRAVAAAAGYIAIMAVGMAMTGHLFGIRYGDPQMVYVLVVFEAAMATYAVVVARRLFGTWHCGFGPIDWRGRGNLRRTPVPSTPASSTTPSGVIS